MKKLVLMITLSLFVTVAVIAQNPPRSLKLQGVEMVETISEDGASIIKRPYRWFAGMAEADVESVAIEMAQLEAYATVSRVIENSVLAEAERGTTAVNGNVQKALKSHWEQVSMSIQRVCEPFGETVSTFNDETGLYEVVAKVGIRGDRYVKLLDGAKNVDTEGLSGSDLQQFIDANNAIIDSAKGN